jgi:DNA-binding NtrC family response regulator
VVLCVGPRHDDLASLERIFRGTGWDFLTASSLESSFSALREKTISMVICGDQPPLGAWREILAETAQWEDPPLVIVSARLADERLWVEALNLGAYDVLATPFDATEVVRVVNMAQQHWHHRRKLRDARGGLTRVAASGPSSGE